jgi:hypothetical protein
MGLRCYWYLASRDEQAGQVPCCLGGGFVSASECATVDFAALLPRGEDRGVVGVVGGIAVAVAAAVIGTGHVEVNASEAVRCATIGPCRAYLPRMLDWHWTRAKSGLGPGVRTWEPTLLLRSEVFLQSPCRTLSGVGGGGEDRAGTVHRVEAADRAEKGTRSSCSCVLACCFCVKAHGGRYQHWSASDA